MWLLVVVDGCWLLVVGCRLLAVGCWWLVGWFGWLVAIAVDGCCCYGCLVVVYGWLVVWMVGRSVGWLLLMVGFGVVG